MKVEELTKTVILPLETSQRKNEQLAHIIDEWQTIASTLADYHASFDEYQWGRTKQNPSWYRLTSREHGDTDIHSEGRLAAVHKVGAAFQSWRENGKVGKQPTFGEKNYCRFGKDVVSIHENDTGFGLKVNVSGSRSQDPIWWHIDGADYHQEYCERICNSELALGSTELHYYPDTESVNAHAAVSQDINVHEWDDIETIIGVDLGENALYTLVAIQDGAIQDVSVESGREYRHYRERLKHERAKLQERGERRKAHSARTLYEEYTDYITHNASREIITFAQDFERAGIVLEDLTNYRKSEDPIHDWPYQQIQEKIVYKAKEQGIPLKTTDPAFTSQTCRQCGSRKDEYRNGTAFKCGQCGYQVHADVNGAANIALREA